MPLVDVKDQINDLIVYEEEIIIKLMRTWLYQLEANQAAIDDITVLF